MPVPRRQPSENMSSCADGTGLRTRLPVVASVTFVRRNSGKDVGTFDGLRLLALTRYGCMLRETKM